MKTKLMILAALVLGTIAPAQAGFKIIPGEEYLKEVLPLLASARSSIDLLQFNFFSENGHVRDLAQRLVKIKAAHPEIRIRVALESEKDLGAPKGAATRNNLTKQLLQKSGIEVYPVYGLRDGDIHGVSHTKAIAIDRQTVLAGSTNWTNTSLDKNNEMNLLVNSGELGEAFTRYFDSVISDPSKMHPLTVQSGAVTLLTDTTYFETVRSLIERSSEGDSLDIGMYFFAYRTDADTQAKTLFDELVAAHQRGVKIRLLLERNG
ncbi:MAG: phospholipase D-like domain-containing protein, partial [Bdellovibrionota bacterium]